MPRENEEPIWANEVSSEQENIKSPDLSQKEWALIDKIDFSIDQKEELLDGLGRIARNEIISDPTAQDEVNAPVEAGKIGLKGYDTEAFEKAGKGLKTWHAIKKFSTFGHSGSKNILEGMGEPIDKRKLKKEYSGKVIGMRLGEFYDMAEQFNLNPQEINRRDYSFIFNEQGSKTILRKKTEAEADETAAKVFEDQLKDLETRPGEDLVKQKDSLEEHQKEKEKYKDVLDEDATLKLEEEELLMKELIQAKQDDLNQNMDVIRGPLEWRQKELAGTLEEFSALEKEVAAQAKSYDDEIKDLNNRITKIKGSKIIKETLGYKIAEWEEQKAQTEANKKAFTEKKQALDARISHFKKVKEDIDKTLLRINNIGKTKTELKAEKMEKDKQKKEGKGTVEKSKENIDIFEGGLMYDSDAVDEAETTQWADKSGRGRDFYKELGEDIDEIRKDVAQPVKPGEWLRINKKPAPSTPEAAPATPQTEAKPEQNEKIVKPISEWLGLLGINTAVGPAKEAVENSFKTFGRDFDSTASMNLGQAKQAYARYLINFRYGGGNAELAKAQKQADEKFEEIIK